MFQKGDVYLVCLDPTIGAEIKKSRPAVILSNNIININSPIVIVCPITDSTGKTSPVHILINKNEGGLTKESVANCVQIRAVDKSRLYQKIGNLSAQKMSEIEKGIKYIIF